MKEERKGRRRERKKKSPPTPPTPPSRLVAAGNPFQNFFLSAATAGRWLHIIIKTLLLLHKN
jgi:hypothetical protein